MNGYECFALCLAIFCVTSIVQRWLILRYFTFEKVESPDEDQPSPPVEGDA